MLRSGNSIPDVYSFLGHCCRVMEYEKSLTGFQVELPYNTMSLPIIKASFEVEKVCDKISIALHSI